MTRIFILALAAFAGNCLTACSFNRAQTKFGTRTFGGIQFLDTKDNDISFDEMTFDPVTKSGTIKNLKIRNNASDPQAIFNQTILANNELQKTYGENTAKIMGKAVDLLNAAAPLVTGLVAARNERAAIDAAAPNNDLVPMLFRIAGGEIDADKAREMLRGMGHTVDAPHPSDARRPNP